MKRRPAEIQRRQELEDVSLESLVTLRDSLSTKRDRLRDQLGRQELLAALARRRAMRATGDALIGARLDLRLERLFEAVRKGGDPWPVDEVVRVIDGLVGRLISRRISLAVIGLFTVIPAVASLVLLATQNQDLIEKNVTEEAVDFREDRANLTDVLFARMKQVVGEGEEATIEELPVFHRRLRSEAFSTLIALEKQRWTPEELEALPPTRYVDFRGGDLSTLNLGGAIGLEAGASKTDFTRLRLDGADLSYGSLLFSRLDGTVFRGARGEGMTIVSPSADGADFTGFEGPGAAFEYNAKTQDFFSMTETVFDEANLEGARFVMVYLERASFDRTRLAGVIFQESNFFECDFSTADLGESADWSNSSFHRCLVTDAQAELLVLPEYVFREPAETPGLQRLMTDPEKYQAWYEAHAAEMDAKARAELEELGLDPDEVMADP